MTGGRVGNWILGEEIGRGSLGTTYRDRSTEDGRAAAVKILTPDSTRPPDFWQSFPAAMLFLQRLNHPNIARFYESGVSGGMAFYASEFVDGTNLATTLRNRPRKQDEPGLSWTDHLLRIAVQLARALRHGHHRSILHRSIQPANVLLAVDGTVKLTDFGVDKLLSPPPLSLSADAWGTIGFLAPEYFTGKPYTKRSDLYALGGVLYT
ncbi:MAG: serine/threonine protein kinase, partial [Bacteroidales bacterium]|nr:serine/threonine protein kinase [Bacteroidales bacterium]